MQRNDGNGHKAACAVFRKAEQRKTTVTFPA